jgi:hypothetical protein
MRGLVSENLDWRIEDQIELQEQKNKGEGWRLKYYNSGSDCQVKCFDLLK